MSKVVVWRVSGAGEVERVEESALAELPETGWVWVDVTAPDAATMERLAQPLGLHPLAVEDALHEQRRPKLDLYPEGPFLSWIVPHIRDDGTFFTEEIDFFLLDRVLVTSHARLVEAIDEVASDGRRTLSRGPDWVMHGIIDRLVDSLLPVVDAVGDELEDVEDDMLGEPRKSDLDRLYALRRQLLALHRVVAPEREIVRELARSRDVVSEDAYRYFQDIGDHLARVEDSLETYRDVGSAVMDIYLSAQNNRMNEIMKQLTVVATIFMPLTLLSGIYGMNLLVGMWPQPLAWWSFPAVVLSMLIIAVAMGLYFRRKNWW